MDNDFRDFLTNNWNEKFKENTSSTAQLEQIQQQQQLQHHQQQEQHQELQKISSFSPSTNRMFMDELANIRSQQQQQQRINATSLSFSPTSQHFSNHSQTNRQSPLNNSRSSTQQQQTIDIKQELRLSNLVLPTSTLRLPDDTTICRSTLINNLRGNGRQTLSVNTSAFNETCSSIGAGGVGASSVGQDIADSTTPPPSSSTSNSLETSSMSLIGAIGDSDKKTANSIRGNLIMAYIKLPVVTCDAVIHIKLS